MTQAVSALRMNIIFQKEWSFWLSQWGKSVKQDTERQALEILNKHKNMWSDTNNGAARETESLPTLASTIAVQLLISSINFQVMEQFLVIHYHKACHL